MTHYRLCLQIDSADADFRFLKRDSDLDHTLTNLPTGRTISAYIIAAHPGGDDAPSPTVTKVVDA